MNTSLKALFKFLVLAMAASALSGCGDRSWRGLSAAIARTGVQVSVSARESDHCLKEQVGLWIDEFQRLPDGERGRLSRELRSRFDRMEFRQTRVTQVIRGEVIELSFPAHVCRPDPRAPHRVYCTDEYNEKTLFDDRVATGESPDTQAYVHEAMPRHLVVRTGMIRDESVRRHYRTYSTSVYDRLEDAGDAFINARGRGQLFLRYENARITHRCGGQVGLQQLITEGVGLVPAAPANPEEPIGVQPIPVEEPVSIQPVPPSEATDPA